MIRVLLGALCISFSPVFVKLAGVSALGSAFWRMLFGGLGLLAWLLVRGGFRLPSGRLLAGALFFALLWGIDIAGWHAAILYVGPGMGTLLPNFQAVLLPLLALALFREPVRPLLALALPLALAGLFLVVGPQWGGFGQGSRLGVALGLGAGVFYALYLLALQRLARTDQDDPFRIVTMISLGCALLLALGMLAKGDSFAIPDAASLGILFAYGLFGQVLGWVLITTGVRSTPTALVGLLLLLQPTCSYLWDVLFFDKHIGLLEGAGVLLALAGIYLGGRARPARPNEKTSRAK